MRDPLCERVMAAANILRVDAPRLLRQYLSRLPEEASAGFEEMYYEGLPEETGNLFDILLGLCERYRADREAEVTGKRWRELAGGEE